MLHGEPEYRRRRRQKAEENQRYADREWDEAAQRANVEKVIGSLKGFVEQLERSVDEDAPKNKSDRRRHRWEIGGLWGAAAVGVLAIIIGNWDASQQRDVMRGQLEEMRSSSAITKAQLAPKMKFDWKIEAKPIGNDTVWMFSPIWTNTGQTDAVEWRGWDARVYVPKGLKFVPNEVTIPEMVPSSLAPGESVSQNTMFVNSAAANEALKHNAQIILIGYIEWKESLPNYALHYRHWCARLNPSLDANGSIAFSLPENYNPECNKD